MARPSLSEEINSFNAWTPTQVIQAFGGSTKRAAQEVGVSQRTMERYITSAKQQRRPSKPTQEKLNKAGRKTLGAVGVTFAGDILIGSPPPRDREINRVYSPDAWEDLSALAAAGDEDGCWQFVADEYQVSDMVVTDGEIQIGEE